ncbi:MAG: FmdB family zinc ribbon protein [Acidimicrobiales bacterium]
MPTYEYRCDSCERSFDVVQSFHDEPLTECPTCGAPVRKVFGNVGIVFKGSGFYKTDSRPVAAKSTSGDTSSGDTSSAPASGTDAGASKSESPSSGGAAPSSTATPAKESATKPAPTPSGAGTTSNS